MGDEAGDVGPGILRQCFGFSRRDVHQSEGGGVASAALEHEQVLTRLVQPERGSGQGIVRRNLGKERPTVVPRAFVDLTSAVGRHLLGEVDLHVVVGDVSEVAVVVLLDERHLAGFDVDTVNVVQLRVTIVDPDENLVGEVRAYLLHAGLYAVERRQINDLVRIEIDAVDVPVLVAALVLDVENVSTRVGPEVRADASVCVLGNRFRGGRVVDGTDPDVHDTVNRSTVADVLAIGAELNPGLFRVSEQDGSGNQRRFTACLDLGGCHQDP